MNQPRLAQMPQLAMAGVERPVEGVAEVVSAGDAEGAHRGQRARLGAAESVVVAVVVDVFTIETTRQANVIHEHVARVGALPLAAQAPRTRSMDDLNWMEFAELVPARHRTVILTVGTLEPHGVVNNGADNTAPVAIAKAIAGATGIDALLAPHIPYGVTGSMAPYPGALHIPEESFRAYVRAVLDGLAKNKFRDIIIVNGHGGGQTAILDGQPERLPKRPSLTTAADIEIQQQVHVAGPIAANVRGPIHDASHGTSWTHRT